MLWLLVGYMWLFIHRPFEVWPRLGDYHIERVYMIVTLIYWGFVAEKTWCSNRLNLAFLLLAISILLSAILSPYGSGINLTVENWLKIGVFYILIMSTVRNEVQLRFLVVSFLVVMALYVGHSFREFLNGRHFFRMGIARLIGVDASMNDPNAFGATVLYSLPMIYPLWYEAKKRWKKLLLIGYVFLACGCILLTGSRTAFAGLALLGIILVAFSKYRYTFAAGFIITIPIIWVSLSQDLKNRYLTIVDPSVGPANAEESAESRQEFFWKAVEIWEKNPVLGVGPACFSIASSTHAQAHTLYGQILSELGTLGAIAFAILLWAFFVNWRCAKLLTANIPTLRSTIEYRLVIAVTVTVGLLLFMGLGGHNLFRYTWLWYGAFLAIAVRQITIRYSTADIRLPNSADTCINYLQFDLLT